MEGLLVLLHVHLGQLAALQAQSDPILLLLVQGQDRLAHEGAGEDAALIEGLLQTGVGLAGGLAAAIDGLGDVIDPVGPVLGLLEGVLVRVGKDLPGGQISSGTQPAKPMRAPSMPGNQLTHRVSSWQVMREMSGHSSRSRRTSCS